MTVSVLSLKAGYLELKDEIDATCRRVLETGWCVLGEDIGTFETEYAAFCQAQYYMGFGNGLKALYQPLCPMEVGPDDEVEHVLLARQ